MNEMSQMKSCRGRHPLLCKWWMRVEPLKFEPSSRLQSGARFYVPWWAWPLELVHRAIFGRVKIGSSRQPSFIERLER